VQPLPSSIPLYDDALLSGWSVKTSRATFNPAVTSPVAQGAQSLSLAITGKNGYVTLSGWGVPLAGKTHLRFWLHGGRTGRQALQLQATVDGVVKNSVKLSTYGVPQANGWVQYAIPLSQLGAASGHLTGLTFSAASAQSAVYVDWLRVD